MARYTGPVCRLCRREGEKLYLKGERCLTDKCSVDRRSYPPGMHGRGRIKQSEYLLQLREKQKAKRYYRLAEKQFRTYYERASAQRGVTGENLLRILETRLDNVVYRLGFSSSRAEARLLIGQGHFTVNGRRVTIPSYQVRTGDTVGVKKNAKATERIRTATEGTSAIAAWLQADHENLQGQVLRFPERIDIDAPVQEQLIVELYSK